MFKLTRECPLLLVDRSQPARRVVEALETLLLVRGTPHALDAQAYWNHVQLDFSRPGKPVDNTFIEAFNGSLRRECLSQHWFASLPEAAVILGSWKREYNTERPHSS